MYSYPVKQKSVVMESTMIAFRGLVTSTLDAKESIIRRLICMGTLKIRLDVFVPRKLKKCHFGVHDDCVS